MVWRIIALQMLLICRVILNDILISDLQELARFISWIKQIAMQYQPLQRCLAPILVVAQGGFQAMIGIMIQMAM